MIMYDCEYWKRCKYTWITSAALFQLDFIALYIKIVSNIKFLPRVLVKRNVKRKSNTMIQVFYILDFTFEFSGVELVRITGEDALIQMGWVLSIELDFSSKFHTTAHYGKQMHRVLQTPFLFRVNGWSPCQFDVPCWYRFIAAADVPPALRAGANFYQGHTQQKIKEIQNFRQQARDIAQAQVESRARAQAQVAQAQAARA